MARVGALLRRFAQKAPQASANSANASAAPSNNNAESDTLLDDDTLGQKYGLTPRQAAVARLLTQGLSNEEVADQLGISRFTARNHTEQVLAKIGAPTRARVGAILRGNVLLS
jgi:DNA-binding CsgD family transcriptional regulator